jgi:tRNA pseudouridine55 synthase
MTSHDAINRLRRLYGTRRVGHTGTLDPQATGVLVVCLEQATRIVEYLTAARKEYIAGVVFGLTTDTEDITGQTLAEKDAGALTGSGVQAVLPRFRGTILQVPPMVSAIHHKGKRLYELARQGIAVERQARPVEVYRLDLIEFHPGARATASLQVECSTGTYIRTLAADIGMALGVGGAMTSLTRTRVGTFTLAEAFTLEELAARKAEGCLKETIRPIPDALSDWPRVVLSRVEAVRAGHGQVLHLQGSDISRAGEDSLVLMLDEAREAVGIGRLKGRHLAPIKVFRADT